MYATRRLKSEGLLVVNLAQIRSSTTLGDYVCPDTSAGTACVKLPHNQIPLCLQPALTLLWAEWQNTYQDLSSDNFLSYIFSHHYLEHVAFFACDFLYWETQVQPDRESNQLISGPLCLPEKTAHYASCSPQGHGVYATYNPNTQIIKPERPSWKRNSPNIPANTILSVALLHKQRKT